MASVLGHIRSDKIKWGIAGFVLVALIAAVVVLSLFIAGVFDKREAYRFEAEAAELNGGCVAMQAEDGVDCVGEFINAGTGDRTITYNIYATEDTEAALLVRIAADNVDRNISDLMEIQVNGVTVNVPYRVVKYADPRTWADWREVEVCEIQLNKGLNKLVFTGTYVGTNFDYIELTTDGTELFCN